MFSRIVSTNQRLALAASVVLAVIAVQAQAQVSVICPSDMTVSNDPGICSAVVEFPDPIIVGLDPADVVTITPPSGSEFPVGTNEVVVSVTNGGTNLAECSFLVIVEDNEAPVITGLCLDKSELWPPNHKLVCVTVKYHSTDNCDEKPECSLSVSSNEPCDGSGDGHTSSDWNVLDAHHVQLRAERSGNGSGRTYTITVTCTDSSGNSSSDDITVCVPHDQGKGKQNKNNGDDDKGNGKGKGKGKNK